MSTFEQIYKIVDPILKHYRNDLEVHDRETLQNYSGKFLYGYRPTGTDLLKLIDDLDSVKWIAGTTEEDKIKFIREEIIWITHPDRNTKFLYFDGKKLVHVTRERANLLHRLHIDRVLFARRQRAIA